MKLLGALLKESAPVRTYGIHLVGHGLGADSASHAINHRCTSWGGPGNLRCLSKADIEAETGGIPVKGVALHDYDGVWAPDNIPYAGQVSVLSFTSGGWADSMKNFQGHTGYHERRVRDRYPRAVRLNIPDLGHDGLSDQAYYLGGPAILSRQIGYDKSYVNVGGAEAVADKAGKPEERTNKNAKSVVKDKPQQDLARGSFRRQTSMADVREAVCGLTHAFLGAPVVKETVVSLEFQLAAHNDNMQQQSKDKKDAAEAKRKNENLVRLLEWEDGKPPQLTLPGGMMVPFDQAQRTLVTEQERTNLGNMAPTAFRNSLGHEATTIRGDAVRLRKSAAGTGVLTNEELSQWARNIQAAWVFQKDRLIKEEQAKAQRDHILSDVKSNGKALSEVKGQQARPIVNGKNVDEYLNNLYNTGKAKPPVN